MLCVYCYVTVAYVCIPSSYLVLNVCNQGKTLCSPCIQVCEDSVSFFAEFCDCLSCGKVGHIYIYIHIYIHIHIYVYIFIYIYIYLYLTAIGQPPGGSCSVLVHTNNTENVTKQTKHRTTQKYIEQHKNTQNNTKNTWNNTKIRKSAGCAPSLRVLPWHLPYN